MSDIDLYIDAAPVRMDVSGAQGPALLSGGGEWGTITGTLSDQTDLQSALNAKAASSHTHGNITNLGAIGTTADLVVTTTTDGVLTTSSRSGIDSRTAFPTATANISDATTNAATSPEKVLKSSTQGDLTLRNLTLSDEGESGFTVVFSPITNTLSASRSIATPNASGTLALTAQGDGTIRATDLDFANTADIGAGLADADEILVSDGGGNTTRRKSALSRVWTWIQTKTLPVASGGTGATTAADARTNLELGTGNSPTFANVTASTLATSSYFKEGVTALGTVVSTSTITITGGSHVTATLTASTACTFTMPTAASGLSFILYLKQAASTGNGTATFTGVVWSGGSAPTITATAGKMDILSFVAGPDAAGTGYAWYGSALQNVTPP